eukprot:2584714-Amphidinium_carterae.1
MRHTAPEKTRAFVHEEVDKKCRNVASKCERTQRGQERNEIYRLRMRIWAGKAYVMPKTKKGAKTTHAAHVSRRCSWGISIMRSLCSLLTN